MYVSHLKYLYKTIFDIIFKLIICSQAAKVVTNRDETKLEYFFKFKTLCQARGGRCKRRISDPSHGCSPLGTRLRGA